MKKLALLLLSLAFACSPGKAQTLTFDSLPTRWDEALPIGNGLLGGLVWQKDGKLRLSLDRADLWDTRPMPNMDDSTLTYQWVAEQVRRGEYGIVQEKLDRPYEREPGPSKLPGAALEFDISQLGPVGKADLDITTGLVSITWQNGAMFQTFIHAQRREGWFRWQAVDGRRWTAGNFPVAKLIPPKYDGDPSAPAGSVAGDDLARLGYRQAEVQATHRSSLITHRYHQPCWGGFSYEVAVAERISAKTAFGTWSVSSHFPEKIWAARAEKTVRKSARRGFAKAFAESQKWWANYWAASSVSLPDSVLQRQYLLDNYKFGCLARANAPMISLQGIWTADNGRLPPWKGDLHHDLNTEMSYWHAYAANHLGEATGYLRHIRSNEAAHRAWTRRYFGTAGLNVPGVETLLGQPMGGWIQYACSPTTAAWLSQHFYLHWRFSQDRAFLKTEAWPFLRDVATHLAALTFLDKNGRRVLPLSSSPEINDNAINAWFPETWTNYDLALARFVFGKTAELATELGEKTEAEKWQKIIAELPGFAREPSGALMFAPTLAYAESHRHFSHLLAVHPLGLLDWAHGEADQKAIRASIDLLEKHGPDQWTGYSWAWLANLHARAGDGAKAARALRIFAEAFVSKNSFHVNGDQSGRGFSRMTYRPFTLEGNFAAAAGVQEMLLQSQGGHIRVFPAVPDDWRDVSFRNLRAEGAFLVSAARKNGQCVRVEITSEKGGPLDVQLPPGAWVLEDQKGIVNWSRRDEQGRWQGVAGKGRLVFELK